MPSKQAFLYVFDRVTGQPVWPIEERPMPKGDVPGEWYPPTQPIPTKPPAYSRNYLRCPTTSIDFTPELRAKALENIKRYKVGTPGMPYNPPIVGKLDGLLGAINIGNLGGGTNWPGGGYDPEGHTVYVQAANAGHRRNIPRRAARWLLRYPLRHGRRPAPRSLCQKVRASVARPTRRRRRPSRRRRTPPATPNLLNVDGLSIMKPPYGVLAAINLDRGDMVWQVPHGETPDARPQQSGAEGA